MRILLQVEFSALELCIKAMTEQDKRNFDDRTTL